MDCLGRESFWREGHCGVQGSFSEYVVRQLWSLFCSSVNCSLCGKLAWGRLTCFSLRDPCIFMHFVVDHVCGPVLVGSSQEFQVMGKWRGAQSSFSLGATREFQVMGKWRGAQPVSIPLADGDICTMEGMMQKHYLHRVPFQGSPGPRINLTCGWIRRHCQRCAPRLVQIGGTPGKLPSSCCETQSGSTEQHEVQNWARITKASASGRLIGAAGPVRRLKHATAVDLERRGPKAGAAWRVPANGSIDVERGRAGQRVATVAVPGQDRVADQRFGHRGAEPNTARRDSAGTGRAVMRRRRARERRRRAARSGRLRNLEETVVSPDTGRQCFDCLIKTDKDVAMFSQIGPGTCPDCQSSVKSLYVYHVDNLESEPPVNSPPTCPSSFRSARACRRSRSRACSGHHVARRWGRTREAKRCKRLHGAAVNTGANVWMEDESGEQAGNETWIWMLVATFAVGFALLWNWCAGILAARSSVSASFDGQWSGHLWEDTNAPELGGSAIWQLQHGGVVAAASGSSPNLGKLFWGLIQLSGMLGLPWGLQGAFFSTDPRAEDAHPAFHSSIRMLKL